MLKMCYLERVLIIKCIPGKMQRLKGKPLENIVTKH